MIPANDVVHKLIARSVHYRTVNIWNNLNNDIKLCIDVNSFRNKLRGVLLDKFKREE